MRSPTPYWQTATPMLLVAACCAAHVLADENSDQLRKYQNGPLRIEEFVGKPNAALDGDAYTATRIEFRFNYTVHRKPARFAARLTKFDAFSVFLPRQSWWKPRARTSLLDHEQGHFDIAESTARRIQLAFDKSRFGGKIIEGTGATSEAANKALRLKLRNVIKLANERLTQDNLEYDATTSHGMRVRSQFAERRIQLATLQHLAKEIASVRKTQRRSAETR